MKKIFTLFAAAMMALSMSAASFGIMINGTEGHQGQENPSPGDPSFQEFMVLGVSVNNGATIQLWDFDSNAGWAVDLDPASVTTIVRDGDHYNCTADGCYDFYIKLKYNADQLYIGSCSGENPPVTPGEGGNPRYYYKGYIDGQDVEPSEATIFEHGLAELDVNQDAYIFILYQVDGYPGVQYMTTSYVDGPTHATVTTSGNEKFHLGAGSYTLYLYDNGDGTLEVSTESIPGKKLADPQPQGIENTSITEKARKVIIDGQLRIVRGDKIYDATGRQL